MSFHFSHILHQSTESTSEESSPPVEAEKPSTEQDTNEVTESANSQQTETTEAPPPSPVTESPSEPNSAEQVC